MSKGKAGKGTTRIRGGKAKWAEYKCKCGMRIEITERSIKNMRKGVRCVYCGNAMSNRE